MRNIHFASVALAATAVSVVAFVACDDDTASKPTDYGPTLNSITESIILPGQSTLVTQADALVAAAGSFQTTPDVDSLAKVQTAWRATRAAWRSLDAVHFGPVDSLGITPRIDFPHASPKDIDDLVAGTGAIDDAAVGKAGGGSKGFLGLEYLVFSKDDNQAIAVRFQGDGAAERRRALVKAIADEIAASAHQLADAWAVGKGGYASELENAGAGSTHYPTQRAAIDELVAGVGFALEVIVGVRLAEPLGRKSGGTPDPSQDPTAASDSAVDDMTNTLAGVRAIYTNDGFSARIRAKTPALDDRLKRQIGDCGAKVTAIPKPFDSSVTNATGTVNAAYDSCKTLKVTWNTDLTSSIGATLKPGDSDGD